MPKRIQSRHGTASEWSTANPVLFAGEVGVETDTHKGKFGDGTTVWSALPYVGAGLGGGGGSTVTVDADGSLVVDGTTVEMVTDNDLTSALLGKAAALDALKGWALAAAFWFTGAPTVNGQGTITGGAIRWPDNATGVYTATTVDANGAVTAFTATTTGGPLANKTVTVTIPRNTDSIVNGAMTVTVA